MLHMHNFVQQEQEQEQQQQQTMKYPTTQL